MKEKQFTEQFAEILRQALMLNDAVHKFGLEALDSNIWNLDDEDFKQGLVLVRDEVNPAIIDEILSNKAEYAPEGYERRFKVITKRAVLGIQEGLSSRLLMKVLLSYANLSPDAQKEIEYAIFTAENEDEIEIEGETFTIENVRHWAMIKESIEYANLSSGVVFDLTNRSITITSDCGNPPAVKEIIAAKGE